MQLTIDTTKGVVSHVENDSINEYSIDSPQGFALLSQAWLRAGWGTKYVYTFTWFGRPIIQLPEDIMRVQEVITSLRPDVIIETGIAHGGSLILYASLCKALSKGRIIGIDIEIRPHNRKSIEEHDLFPYITLIEGDAISKEVVQYVHSLIKPHETVLVLLDSNHTKAHVSAELEAYHDLVTPGSYIVATDGIMEELVGAPRSQDDWKENNPKAAALDFVAHHPEFVIEQPRWLFNESSLTERETLTYWPSAWLRRIR